VKFIQNGESVVLLCLGDTSLFASSSNILRLIKNNHAEIITKTIPGISSISAAAALNEFDLVKKGETLIIKECPSSESELTTLIRESKANKTVLAIMKVGKRWNLVRKILKKKIIGITCHNSKKLIRYAVKDGANYIAIGAFFKSKTKKVNFIAKPSLISWAKRFTKLPVVIIGGITNKNFRKLLLHKPDFLAISGGIWDKKPAKAIKEFL